ncbi:MAG: hypothetical protein RRC07_00680 [Anaerolineae bacterium]|nr:hypothetical protein [Anaerolineae bacterium]
MPEDKEKRRLTLATRKNLYESAHLLRRDSSRELGVFLQGLWAYVQDPRVAAADPAQGIQQLEVRWEPGLGDGPVSARFAVLDYNADTGALIPPARWSQRGARYTGPDGQTLDASQCDSFQFHQVNMWAVAQSVLDLYEAPQALGRPIPWAFGGNRLILVPHAGYDENAYYDRNSKSLQFYYFGAAGAPTYTCLSHDIIAHEMGHAVLDGIRPFYYHYTSLQTAAFHEAIADLTAIIIAILNNPLRRSVGAAGHGALDRDNAIALLAEEFGAEVMRSSSLRNANNTFTMDDFAVDTSPHDLSQVLTGAMFEILAGIAAIHQRDGRSSPLQALWWAADRFRRLALQPLDFCPPVDIQFADYARAVLKNFLLYEERDSDHGQAYYGLIHDVFHRRQICPFDAAHCRADPRQCAVAPGDAPRMEIIHDINRIARSRAAAYYFLNDNRRQLHIPLQQDIEVVDLYDTAKYGAAAVRLPREIIVEYVWREEVPLEDARFGRLQGTRAELLCGGTLVLDGRGNVLAWENKPGFTGERDVQAGRQRRDALLEHIARQTRFGIAGEPETAVPGPWSPAVVVSVEDGRLQLAIPPPLRNPLHATAEDEPNPWRQLQWTTSF